MSVERYLNFVCKKNVQMNIEVKRFQFEDTELTKTGNQIRQKVFVEEQKVDPKLEYDEFEKESQFYMLFVDEQPAGTARWRHTEKGIKLERFAVLKEYRNKGYGSELLKDVMKDIVPLKKTIYLHSQLKAVNYYQRIGFKAEGPQFLEANIWHYMMVYVPGA